MHKTFNEISEILQKYASVTLPSGSGLTVEESTQCFKAGQCCGDAGILSPISHSKLFRRKAIGRVSALALPDDILGNNTKNIIE
ncbi:hypothetical protein CEXT_456301 [Caerostris extrusa]|uniref:Uncharacterized protein n=1 Tax=Caerostris extrusa TaxID=172846 RepID=A0AAV4N9R7_CAEEX|nr:hypothetical protein CEXT_456301 [Caerostris extrusa]